MRVDDLEWDEQERDRAVVVTVAGTLTLGGAVRLGHLLDKPLMDHGRVVVEVSELRLRWPAGVAVFPTALAAAGGWPSARLVVACRDPAARGVLRAARVPDRVPVVADLAAATLALDVRPPLVTRTTAVVRTERVAQHVRSLVAMACADWELAGCREAATYVGSELATNAFEHGVGDLALRLAVDARGLRVAVRDEGRGSPALTDDGYGLRLVDHLSVAWGVVPERPGKWVWALVGHP